jgi:hypothetical protein
MGPMPRLLSEITSNGEAAFPWKLHRVLEESEQCGFSNIVSWQGNRAFKVHDPKEFEKSIMQKYFNQTRYKSFQRQRKYHQILLSRLRCMEFCCIRLVAMKF